MVASMRAAKRDPGAKKDESDQEKDDKGSANTNNLIVQLME